MLERFSRVSNLNIIVIGDIILDEYITGTATRMSAEAPIPIVDKTDTYHVLGGSANVASNIKSLGANPILIGTIGNDTNGGIVMQKLESLNISTEYLLSNNNKPTCIKSRVLVDGKQIFRIDDEDNSNITNQEETTIKNLLQEIIQTKNIDGIILQDYNKGVFTKSMIPFIISLAKKHDIKTFVDPKFNNYWDYKDVSYFKPNKGELYQALKKSNLSIREAVETTRQKLSCEHIICTLAEEGMVLSSASEYIHNPTKKIDLVDVSGAGDSTLTMITLSVLLGYDHLETLRLSNATGRAACCKLGVSTISLDDIKNHL